MYVAIEMKSKIFEIVNVSVAAEQGDKMRREEMNVFKKWLIQIRSFGE